MSKTKGFVIAFVLVIAVIAVASVYWYYYSYPLDFQIYGKFSTRSMDIRETFEYSEILAQNFVFRTFKEDDNFKMTIEATRGWEAKTLTVYNTSRREYPLIYDIILFQTNGSVSLQIEDPRFLFISLQNMTSSIFTGKADSVFFVAEAGRSLLIENVTSAYIPFSTGNPIVIFQVIGGNISVSDGFSLFRLTNKDDMIAIRLEMQVLAEAEIALVGKFAFESNTFSSVTVNCWTSPLTAYFPFPRGFLSYPDATLELHGSENLDLKQFRGEITLLNPNPPHEITVEGYSDKIFVGETEVTAPDFYRDSVRALSPYSALIVALMSTVISVAITTMVSRSARSRENEKNHLRELKDYLFAPILEALEEYYYPQIRLRATGRWTYLLGLISHDEDPVDLDRLELKVNRRLLLDLPNHSKKTQTKLEEFRGRVEEYNRLYLNLADKLHELLIDLSIGATSGPFGFTGVVFPNGSSNMGKEIEWAFRLLIGAHEDELEEELDTTTKKEGLRILSELKRDTDIVGDASEIDNVGSELEELIQNLIRELNELLKCRSITGKCDMIE